MTTLVRPIVKIAWDGSDISTDHLQLSMRVGQNPTAQVAAYSGEDAKSAAQTVMSSEMVGFMERAQRAAFGPTSEPNFNIQVDDGVGNTLAFKGFASSPTYSVDSQGKSLRPTVAVLSEATVLSNLRMDIYKGPLNAAGEPLGSPAVLLQDRIHSANFATRLSQLTSEMITDWELVIAEYPPDTTADALRDAVHSYNTTSALPLWYKLLENSESSLNMPWLPAIARERSISAELNAALLSMMRGSSSNFESMLAAMSSEFFIQYIPNADGSIGRLEQRSQRMLASPVTVDIPASSVVMGNTTANPSFPIQQVLMMSKPENVSVLPATNVNNAGGFVGISGYPTVANQSNGNVLAVPLPFHLELFTTVRTATIGDNPSPSISGAVKAFKDIRTLTQTFLDEGAKRLLREHAKVVYMDAALGDSTVSLRVPLDLKWTVGERYQPSLEGRPLFRGFLQGVEHTISRGDISTTLNFTHVEFGSYRLPL